MTDSKDFTDPYLDPRTGLLRNLVGAETKIALDDAEGDLAFTRGMQLMDRPPKPTGDLDELQAIHRQLFQDVYEWAGQLRTVDIRKNTPGAEYFLPVSMIERASVFAAGELREDNMLRGLDRERFVDRLAYHYDAFNYIHPFREGNGRTQRVFWNRIARDAGWQLDWRSVHGSVNDHASRVAAEQRDFGPLREMFDSIVTQAAPAARRDGAWRAAEMARMSFPKPASAAARGDADADPDRGRPRRGGGPQRQTGGLER
ncbi:cell filamentation protein Fic (plasmid) [Humibacter sp. BT305]|nr:cell filamentation protein Fic [Humibacter sp. BT305]